MLKNIIKEGNRQPLTDQNEFEEFFEEFVGERVFINNSAGAWKGGYGTPWYFSKLRGILVTGNTIVGKDFKMDIIVQQIEKIEFEGKFWLIYTKNGDIWRFGNA